MRQTPSRRNSGRGKTKKQSAVSTAVAAVLTPSQSLRRPPASERCPVTGASRAMASPAMARAAPSAAEAASSPPKALDVRYTVKTNVVITALKAADPQSQEAHARIWPFLEATGPEASSDVGWEASGTAAAFIARCYSGGEDGGRMTAHYVENRD